jgi:hypothetical protein
MADALLALLRRQAIELLEEARRELQANTVIANLGPAGPGWDGTALAGHLRRPVPASGALGSLAAQVVKGLRSLTVVDGADPAAGLFGWDADAAGPGSVTGIAWAVRAEIDGGTLAAALVADGSRQVRLIASGTNVDGDATLPLGSWTLRIGGQLNGTIDLRWAADGPPTIDELAPDGKLRLELQRPARPPPSPPPPPSFDLGAVGLSAELTVKGVDRVVPSARMKVTGGSLRLDPTGLSSLLPGLGAIPVDVDLSAGEGGSVTITGPRVRLPTVGALPGMRMGPLEVRLGAVDRSVSVKLRTSLAFTLPGTPLHIDLQALGIDSPFSVGQAERLGFGDVRMPDPSGAGLALKLPVVNANGRLLRRGPNRYAGVLGAEVPPLSASAIGALGLDPVSFVAILAATFPPPGIQIGFGFSVNGVGGVIGVHRRVDREALMRAVADGSVAHLLFPRGPVAGAESSLGAVDAIFPPQRGSVLAGPMVELTWGRQLVTGVAALILEVSDQPRVSLLGKLVVALPTAKVPLISMQATFAGQADPGEPSLTFLASLTGRIVGVPFSGDLFLLARGGPETTFVLTGGGFHPRFAVPRGVPALRRLSLELSASPLVRLRCEAYLAITSNTVQFGARLELVAEVAGCGLRGHLQLDVLVQFRPHLYFVAELSAAIAVRVAGLTLAGIHLQLSLEGPTQWRARGRGTVDLFLFSASFDFDERWGTPHPLPSAPPDVKAALEQAFSQPEAWIAHRPASVPAGVRLTEKADRRLGEGELVDPFGSVTARQRVVPLDVRIERFERLPLAAPETWRITGVRFGDRSSERPRALVSEQFAPGQFLSLTDDEQLGQRAFRSFTAGGDLVSRGVVIDTRDMPADIDFEEDVRPGPGEEPVPIGDNPFHISALMLAALELIISAGHVSHPAWWDPPAAHVLVAEEPPMVPASTWSLAPVAPVTVLADPEAPVGEPGEVLAEDPGVTFVEAWELEG